MANETLNTFEAEPLNNSEIKEELTQLNESIESPEDDPQIFATFFGIDKDRIKEVQLDMATKTYFVTVDLPFTFSKDNKFSEVNAECTIPVKYEVGKQ